MSIRIIGTGHIFELSVKEVRNAIVEDKPDIVAVELDEKRYWALEEQGFSTDLPDEAFSLGVVLRETVRGGSLLVLLQVFLSAIQRELSKNYGVKPGADMCAAIVSANEVGGSVALIDRDIETTLNHLLAIPFREKIRLFTTRDSDLEVLVRLLGGDLERILEEDNLDKVMGSLKKSVPSLYSALVDERDRYMSVQLDTLQKRNPDAVIVAVVGAGHKKGIQRYLEKLDAGFEISLRPLIALRRTSFFSVVFLILAIVLAYIMTKVRFRGR